MVVAVAELVKLVLVIIQPVPLWVMVPLLVKVIAAVVVGRTVHVPESTVIVPLLVNAPVLKYVVGLAPKSIPQPELLMKSPPIFLSITTVPLIELVQETMVSSVAAVSSKVIVPVLLKAPPESVKFFATVIVMAELVNEPPETVKAPLISSVWVEASNVPAAWLKVVTVSARAMVIVPV